MLNESKNILLTLNSLMNKKDKRNLGILVLFSIFISILEVVGISAIMPFISVVSDSGLITSNPYYSSIYNFFGFKNYIDFIMIFALILIIYYLFRGVINIVYIYLLNRFTQGRYHFLSHKLFSVYMGMPYKTFVSQNSAEMTKTIVTEANLLSGLIAATLLMFSEIIIMLFIYIMMLWVNYKIALILTLILGLNAILMMKTVTTKIKSFGRQRAQMHSIFYELLNRSFGNFKFIKLSRSGAKIINEFHTVSHDLSRIAIAHQTYNNVPRLFLEGIGFSIIVGLVAFLMWDSHGNTSTVMPTISLFVLSLYRLLPSVNKIMNSINTIHYSSRSLELVKSSITIPIERLDREQIEFKNTIMLEKVTFGYDTEKPIFKDLDLMIHKGEKVGFLGESGSGKSTLVDLIIGLYQPTQGILRIDKHTISDKNIQSWRGHVGYIPQSVYLFDGNVADNVVFGREYNEEKIIKVLMQANIYPFLQTKEGIETKVGEGGVILSGGQKQRIAIARALYGDPDVLVLDEATSALDDTTEKKIMDEIYDISKDKTLLVIAHRLSTLDRCTSLYKLEFGKIIRVENE